MLFHQTTLYQLWSPSQPSTPPQKPMPVSPGLSFNPVRGADGWDIRYDLKEELGKLMNYLIKGFNVLHDYPLAIILSFDEALTLTEASTDDVDGLWSRFSVN